VLKDWGIARLLTGLEGEKFKLKIKKPNSQVIELALTHRKTEEVEVYPAFESNRQLLDFK
jgi:hypothetical protein